MNNSYDTCPFCGKALEMNNKEYGSTDVTYACNNEKEIIFAKAARGYLPEYHSFSYTSSYQGFPGKATRWMIQFSLSPKRIVRLIRHADRESSTITDRFGRGIFVVAHPLEPDFPDLTKLKNKIRTYFTFS
jgi:hypothetical protein